MKLKKSLKIISLGMVIITAGLLWLGCASSSSPTAPPQVATVQRGNITTVITGSGNLAFSKTQDLVFQISGMAAAVNVEVGDNVTQGQVLARLDTTDLEQALTTADLAVKSSQIDLANAQNAQSNIIDQELAVQSSQISLKVAQNAQTGINSAQIDLETATNSLTKISYPYNYSTFAFDVPAAIVAINDARLKLNLASADLQPGSSLNYGDALMKFQQALDSLTMAEQRLAKGVNPDLFVKAPSQDAITQNATAFFGNNPWNTTDFWTLRAADLSVAKAKLTLENTRNNYQTGLEQANLNLVKAQQALAEAKASYQTGLDKAKVNLDTANNNLLKAQRNLDKATITAPFSGIVTAVNISGGQQVNSGQVAISIADPNKLEADVLVNEVDIPWVAVGGDATLQVDAVSALNLPAKVTAVAPTATVQSGVVNYSVTIGLQSNVITPAQPGQTAPGGQSGQTRQGQQGQRPSTPRAAQSGMPSTIQLRQGLSVTASIIKQQKTGVLLVPSAAITQQGISSLVSVVKSDGTTEQRQVTTGLTDGVNTEITSGLSEGEKVLLPLKTASTTTPAQPGGAIPFRPGGGLIR